MVLRGRQRTHMALPVTQSHHHTFRSVTVIQPCYLSCLHDLAWAIKNKLCLRQRKSSSHPFSQHCSSRNLTITQPSNFSINLCVQRNFFPSRRNHAWDSAWQIQLTTYLAFYMTRYVCVQTQMLKILKTQCWDSRSRAQVCAGLSSVSSASTWKTKHTHTVSAAGSAFFLHGRRMRHYKKQCSCFLVL